MKEFKQFLVNKMILFFMLTTGISVAIFFIGSAFDKDARFGYEALLVPAKYAFLCVLPTLVTYSRRELSIKMQIFRTLLELLLVEAVVLGIAFDSDYMDTGNISVTVALAASVLIIFAAVYLFAWFKDAAEAVEMNQTLVELQRQELQKN